MDLIQAALTKPGDKVIYRHGETGSLQSAQSSIHWQRADTYIVSGYEYIVSSVLGISKSGANRFLHFVKGKPILDSSKEDPIISLFFELELFDNRMPYNDFEKRSKDPLELGYLSIDDIIESEPKDYFVPIEFLTEMVDKSCKYNLYNLPINDYLWYIDLELARTLKNSFEEYENMFESITDIAQEEGRELDYSMSEGFEKFKQGLEKERIYFQGIKNVCETLTDKYQLKTYGDVIKRFANNGVTIKDINSFYTKGWLGKKEFQYAISSAYEHYPIEEFDNYRW